MTSIIVETRRNCNNAVLREKLIVKWQPYILTYLLASVSAHAASASPAVAALAERCSPDVSPLTMAYIVGHESGNNPYAININGGKQLARQPQNELEAIAVASSLLEEHKNIDMGLAQINSTNLGSLHIDLNTIFKPCNNLLASQIILKSCYHSSLKSWKPGQEALHHALSCYNTGSQDRGIANGYVTKVEQVAANSDLKIPTLMPDGQQEDSGETADKSGSIKKPYDGEPDVFAQSGSGDDAFSQHDSDAFLTKSAQVEDREGTK